MTDLDDPTSFSTAVNESGYGSRAEIECLGETKQSFHKDDPNLISDNKSLELQFGLRRRKKPSIIGEDRFNKLSDEMILMILKWLPKQCLVRNNFMKRN